MILKKTHTVSIFVCFCLFLRRCVTLAMNQDNASISPVKEKQSELNQVSVNFVLKVAPETSSINWKIL